jgi:hypothetical protein
MLICEPIRSTLLREIVDPNITEFSTESALPNLLEDRIESDEPMSYSEITDNEGDALHRPKIDMLLPQEVDERIDKELPHAAKWSTLTADPKRAKFLKDSVEPSSTSFKTLIVPGTRATVARLKLLPKRPYWRSDMLDPTLAKLHTVTALPKRPIVRTESAEPRRIVSSTEIVFPVGRTFCEEPPTERADPQRICSLNDSDEPKCVKSRTESLDPTLQKLRSESDEPKCVESRTLILEPPIVIGSLLAS